MKAPVFTRKPPISNSKKHHSPILIRLPMVTTVRSRDKGSFVIRWLGKEEVFPASSKETHNFPYKSSLKVNRVIRSINLLFL